MNQKPKIFTDKEACLFLRISAVTLWRARRVKKISFHQDGHGKITYTEHDLKMYLQNQKRQSEVLSEAIGPETSSSTKAQTAILQALQNSESLSISEVCKAAGVARCTYYFHYNNDPSFRRRVMEIQRDKLTLSLRAQAIAVNAG
jgi:hypothetical protein